MNPGIATASTSIQFEYLLHHMTISTSNALPFRRVKRDMDELIQPELHDKVLLEEATNSKSIMEFIIPTSTLNKSYLEKITYKIHEAPGWSVNGAPVFDSNASKWHLDKYHGPKGRANASGGSRRKKKGGKKQKQKYTKQKKLATDTETDESGGSQISVFPPPSTPSDNDGAYQPGKLKADEVSKSTVERKWASLFNTILSNMNKRLEDMIELSSSGSHASDTGIFPFPYANPPHRYWSAKFANTHISDETNIQKPDIVLLNLEVARLPRREVTWADVLTGVEVTDTQFGKDASVYLGIATKAYLIMREQPWRRFVAMFSIAARHLRVHYFDRSGLIITRPIQIDKNPVRVADALNTVTLGKREVLGFDPTMHMCDRLCTGKHEDLRVGAIGWIKRHGQVPVTYSIMEILWRSQGLFSRGTACYRVQNDDGVEYALKDCWVEEDKKQHEVDVLKMVAGTPNVVTLVDEWDVMYDGKADSTSRIRQDGGSLPAGYRDRCHRRILMFPCGKPLSTFSSKLQLLHIFRDLVIAHGVMVNKFVLHGDLSPNNIIIYDRKGYFIDFDHAIIMGANQTIINSRGTGTLPYLSIRVHASLDASTNGIIERSASDDLESLFYIFIELIGRYSMPGSPPDHSAKLRPLWHDINVMSNHTLAAYSKQGVVSLSINPLDTIMKRYVMPYFSSFEPVVGQWCVVLQGNLSKDTIQWATHEKVKAVLDRGLEFEGTLDETLPLPQSSSTSTPPAITDSSSQPAAPRRNPKRNRNLVRR